MAKRTTNDELEAEASVEPTPQVEESPARTDAIDIVMADPEDKRAFAFIAAYDILYNLLGARFTSYEVTDLGLSFHGVSLDASHGVSVEQVINDISEKVRRAPLWPSLAWLNGIAPILNPSTIQTSIVQFWRGTVSSGTTKTPEYIRDAAKAYRESNHLNQTRGPKPKAVNFKDINAGNVTPEILLKGEVDIEKLMAVAQAALDLRDAQSDTVEANA